MPFPLIPVLFGAVVGALSGIGVATAIVVVFACLTIALLCQKVQEYVQKKRNKRYLAAKIKRLYPTANKVDIGLREVGNRNETLTVQGTDIDPEIRAGMRLHV